MYDQNRTEGVIPVNGSLFRTSFPRAAAAVLAVLTGVLFQGQASAGIIWGSGQGGTPGVTQDTNWTVVATPQDFTTANGNLSSAYGDLYTNPWYGYANGSTQIYNQPNPSSGFGAYIPALMPAAYYGMGGQPLDFTPTPQPGITVDGTTYNWISVTSDGSPVFGSPWNQSDYTWIVAQTFTVTQDFNYDFTFKASGDNAVQFFIDGTVSYAQQDAAAAAVNGYWSDAAHPTIIGGQVLHNTADGSTYYNDFEYLGNFKGTGFLAAGQHTAYMVLHDVGGAPAAFIDQATVTPSVAVPEPGTMLLASLASGIGGIAALRRRKLRAGTA